MSSLRRADLHVHTSASTEHLRYGPLTLSIDLDVSPETVARRAFEAGMDYIAITDHDTIDGALELIDRRPDLADRVIVGEEVTTYSVESGAEIHVGVYDIDERDHEELQARRHDLHALLEYARGQRLLYVLNHPIWDADCLAWDAQRLHETIRLIRDHFPVIEGINGSILARHNRLSMRIAERYARFVVGGSDSHTGQVGYAYTEAPGATREAFLDAIRYGLSRPGGRSATTHYVEAEVEGVVNAALAARRQRAATRLLAAGVDAIHARVVRAVVERYVTAQRCCVPDEIRALAIGLVSQHVQLGKY